MTEARLEIKPVVVGDVRRQLSPVSRELDRFQRSSRRAMSAAERDARRLERAYDSIGSGLGRASRGLGTFTRGLFSLQSVALGAATGFAGRTAVDLLIGSNERLETQKLTFKTLVGDVKKSEQLIKSLRATAAKTPFEEADILEAGKRLLRSTGSNIELNKKLVDQASTLAALNPERTVTDAAEAILDAQLGEFERLKEFSIKLGKKDIEKMKKTGEELGDTAIRAIGNKIKDLGAENLVSELAKGVKAKRSTFIDSMRKTFQEVGKEAFEEVGLGIDGLQEKFDELKADPAFREDLKEVSKVIAEAAKFTFQLVSNLPAAIRSLKDFITENSTALKLAGGAFGANKLTGGAVSRGAFALGRRALFGAGGAGGGALAAAAGGLGGVQEVFVVNFGDAGGGGGDFFKRQLAGKGAAGAGGGALTAGELGSLKFGSGGLVGSIGVGGVLGGAAIFGSFAAGLAVLAQATEGTASAMEANRVRLEREAEVAAGRGGSVKQRADRAVRETREAQERQRRQLATGGVRSMLDEALISGDPSAALGAAKGQISGLLKATPRKQRGQLLADLNTELAGFGVEVTSGGKVREARSVTGRLAELTKIDEKLQASPEAAQQLFEEGKLDAIIAEAEGLKSTRARGAALIEKLSKVDVAKIEIPITVVVAPGGDSGAAVAQQVAAKKVELEALLTELVTKEESDG